MLYLNTDGGSRGNPGLAGAGAILSDEAGNILKEGKKSLGQKTNNEAEYLALLFGLEMTKSFLGESKARQSEIKVRLDSELVVKQLNGLYQIKEKNLALLFVEVWNKRVKTFPHLSFAHIRREANQGADRLANQAMDEA